jgi:RNA polymerase sigma factor (sigma-70 family)
MTRFGPTCGRNFPARNPSPSGPSCVNIHVSEQRAGVTATIDGPGDAELISAVRAGDLDAYGVLFERHVEAARRLARQLTSSGDADDLVSDAFAKVLAVLQRGGGPDLAFRAYLLTSVRRLHVDRLRGSARVRTTDDLSPYDPGVPFEDTAVAGFENATAARAFASLPERWQQVLWHTEVEGQKPAEVAPLLGMTPNSVSALAYRAREGLRQAFVTMHAGDALDDDCATTRARLGAYLRGGLSRRDSGKVEAHLEGCRACSAIYLELSEVNADLGAVLAPILLGGAGAGYLAAAHAGAAAQGGVLVALDRGKDWVLHHPVGRAAGAGAAAVVVVAAALTGLTLSGSPQRPAAGPTSPTHASSSNAAPTPPAGGASPDAGADAGPTAAPSVAPPAVPAPPSLPPRLDPSPPSLPVVPLAPGLPHAQQPSAPSPAVNGAPVIATPLRTVAVPPEARSVVIDLTRGATDPDGDPLRVESARIKGRSQHGTVRRGAVPAPTALARPTLAPPDARERGAGRDVTYVPDRSWRGAETIVYVLTDGTSTVRGSVRVTTPNRRPVAGADARAIHAFAEPVVLPVLANDTDPNHDALSVLSVGAVSGPLGGQATPTADGTAVRYTPGPYVTGTDYGSATTFDYTVSDGHGGTATATVTVRYGNTPPQAHGDTAKTPATADRAVVVDVLANDVDADGDALTAALATRPAHGTVTPVGGGLRYEPDADFPAGRAPATDSFTYTVSDGHGGTATATVTVTVAAPTTTLLLENRHVPQTVDHLLSTRFAVSGIPAARHATATITVEGLDSSLGNGGWAFDADKLPACGGWTRSADGTTATLVCHLSAGDNGKELGHLDPYADSITLVVSPDDFR